MFIQSHLPFDDHCNNATALWNNQRSLEKYQSSTPQDVTDNTIQSEKDLQKNYAYPAHTKISIQSNRRSIALTEMKHIGSLLVNGSSSWNPKPELSPSPTVSASEQRQQTKTRLE